MGRKGTRQEWKVGRRWKRNYWDQERGRIMQGKGREKRKEDEGGEGINQIT